MVSYRYVKDGNHKKNWGYRAPIGGNRLYFWLLGENALPKGVSNLAVTRVQYNLYSTMVQNFSLPQFGRKRFLAFRLLDFDAVWSQLHGKYITSIGVDREKKWNRSWWTKVMAPGLKYVFTSPTPVTTLWNLDFGFRTCYWYILLRQIE